MNFIQYIRRRIIKITRITRIIIRIIIKMFVKRPSLFNITTKLSNSNSSLSLLAGPLCAGKTTFLNYLPETYIKLDEDRYEYITKIINMEQQYKNIIISTSNINIAHNLSREFKFNNIIISDLQWQHNEIQQMADILNINDVRLIEQAKVCKSPRLLIMKNSEVYVNFYERNGDYENSQIVKKYIHEWNNFINIK